VLTLCEGPRFRLHNLSRRKTCTNNRYRPFCNSFTSRRWTAASCSEQLGAFKASADPSSCVADGTVPVARLGHMPVQVAVGGIAIRAEPFQADRYDGSPSHPAGRDSNSLPPGPNSLFKRGVNVDVVAGASSYAGLS